MRLPDYIDSNSRREFEDNEELIGVYGDVLYGIIVNFGYVVKVKPEQSYRCPSDESFNEIIQNTYGSNVSGF